jgi:hypothetical protein
MRLLSAVLGLSILVSAPPAAAQDGSAAEPSYEDKAKAAKLADEGMGFYQQGDFTAAAQRFAEAEKIVSAPTIMLQHGRALERLGQWVDAVAKYRAVAEAELKATSSFQQRAAKAEGARELERLGPRLPKIRLVISPAGPAPDLTVDGRKFVIPLTGDFPVDPGEHVIEARRADGSLARRSVTAVAEKTSTVELVLGEEPTRAPVEEPGMHPIALAGWIGIGVGGACLLIATATGIPAIVMKDDLSEKCPNDRCAPPEHDSVGTYDALRWTAGVTLVAGALIAGAGVAGVLLAPKNERATGAESARLLLGPTGAAVEWRLW